MRIYNTDIEIDIEDISLISFIEEKGHEFVADSLRDDFDYKIYSADYDVKEIDDLTPLEIWNYLLKEHSKWVTLEGHGRNIIRHDLHLIESALNEEQMWLELCNNYPNFLAEQIGQLILGDKNGN